MELNFAIASLGVSETQEALLEASYELTNQLGVIKKRGSIDKTGKLTTAIFK